MVAIKPNPFNLTMPPLPYVASDETGYEEVCPSSAPPSRISTNLPPQQAGLHAAVAGLLIPHFFCTAFIVARISSRVFLLRKWFLDDSLILLAWSFSTAVCVVYSVAALTPGILQANNESALQENLESLRGAPGSVHPYIMRTYLGLIFYQLCLLLTKLSILAFYLRMFNSRARERRLAWGTVVFVVLYGIPMLFMSIFQCHPRDGEFFGKSMQCFGFAPLLIASASLHTATDAWLIVLVVPCISRLDLPPRQKVALAVVLSLSIFVIAASLVRLQLSLHRQFRPSDVGTTNILAFFVMTILECDIALICACAPTLRPLAAKLWPKMMGDLKRRSRQPIVATASSEDLTAVSYHGYPWTQPDAVASPARARDGSIASNIHLTTRMPVPPVPTVPMRPRTPGSLSFKSFLSSKTSRSRGRVFTGDDRPIYIRGGERGRSESRPVSLAFDEFLEKYTKTAEDSMGGTLPRRNAISVYVGAENQGSKNRWAESQESFVLGFNDPLSPHRLSPVSGFSGTTYTPSDDEVGNKQSIDNRIEPTPTTLPDDHAAKEGTVDGDGAPKGENDEAKSDKYKP
jgi:hypothetical protein